LEALTKLRISDKCEINLYY